MRACSLPNLGVGNWPIRAATAPRHTFGQMLIRQKLTSQKSTRSTCRRSHIDTLQEVLRQTSKALPASSTRWITRGSFTVDHEGLLPPEFGGVT